MEEERYQINKNTGRDRWEGRPEPNWRDRNEPSPYEDEGDEPKRKAPWLIRFVSWISLMFVFIAIGYGATTLLFKWLDSRGVREPDLITSSEDARRLTLSSDEAGGNKSVGEIEKSLNLHIPVDGGSFETRAVRIMGDYEEQQIERLLAAYLDTLKEGKWIAPSSQLVSLFRSGDWIYLNFNQPFYDSLKPLGKEKAQVALTALIKTIADNFPQVKKVKFYAEGNEIKEKDPLDLSRPWMLPAGK